MTVDPSKRGTIALIAATFVAYLALRGIYIAFPRSLQSTDGAFQTLSAVMRYSSGQVPVRDFYPYLGIGVSASLVPLYVLTGKHLLLSSNLSVAIVLFVAHVGGLLCLFRTAGLRLHTAAVATLAICLALVYAAFDPGNSLRPLRAALPLIVSGLLYFARYRRGRDIYSPGGAAIFGLCLSIAPLWSNDFGPPTVAAFVIAWGWFAPQWRQRTARNIVGLGIVLGVVALVNAPVIAWMGGPERFLAIQAGFSHDQFWYFGPWGPRVQVFSLHDLAYLFYPPYVHLPPLYGAALLTLISYAACVALRRLRHTPRQGDAMAFAVALASFGGAIIPQVGGHIEAGYGDYALNIVMALAIIEAWRVPRLHAAIVGFAQRPVPLRPFATRQIGEVALPLLCLAMTGWFGILAANNVVKTLPLGPQSFAAQAATGVFPRSESPEVACFARVGALFDSYGVRRDQRMVSTYLSALNLAARADQPMKVDSVIHLLGQNFRAESLARVARARPVLFTTIAPDYTPWDRWNERTSWQLFAPIYRAYQPVVRTPQHLIWMRLTDPEQQQRNRQVGTGRSLPCQVHRESGDHTVVEIDGGANSHPVWAQVALDEKVTRTRSGVLAPFRSLLTVKEGPDTKPFFEGFLVERFGFFGWRPNRYGVDQSRHPLVVPFDMVPGERSRLDLFVEPTNGWRLDVNSCQARIAAPQSVDPLSSTPALEDCGTFLGTLSRQLDALGYRRRFSVR